MADQSSSEGAGSLSGFRHRFPNLPPRVTSSGIPIEVVYGETGEDPKVGLPGEFPFTRGIHPTMYRERPWTMRQYAGFSTAQETNRRFRMLLAAGQTGLSTAFDLPTQVGYDPDHPLAQAEVGRVGVSIACLDDALELFEGIPLDKVSTSMTINATAMILLAMYVAVGRRQGVRIQDLTGTIQNDILKEYAARGTYRFPPRPSLRLITDIFAWGTEHLPKFNPISISGYHIREAGSTAAQEVGFTLANGIAYVAAAKAAGLDVDRFAARLSFFFNSHNHFFEEIAKFRAARQLWAGIMRDRFGAKDPKSWVLRFHTQTAGSTLTSQQPENNAVRVTLQALAAVLGGTQSLHTNSKDEALSLPSEGAARLALRTQQIIALESGVTDTVDPLGGSPFVETLTEQVADRARRYIDEIDRMGGAAAAIERGYVQREIMRSAYEYQRAVESGSALVVGVNRFEDSEEGAPEIFRVSGSVADARAEAIVRMRSGRSPGLTNESLGRIVRAAQGFENLFPPVLAAVEANVTVGEICHALEGVFGKHREVPVL